MSKKRVKPQENRKRSQTKKAGIDRRKRLTRRLAWAKVIFIGVMGFLMYRVGYIKIVKGEEYERQVYDSMSNTEKEIKALRGSIVDRNTKPLVTSSLVYNIIMEPIIINGLIEEEKQATLTELATYTGKTVAEIQQMVEEKPKSWYKILKKDISAEDMELLKANKQIKGVWYEESFIRTYPRNELAAQVMGFYNGTQGQYGIEQQYNTFMQGKSGRIFPRVQDGSITVTEVAPSKMGDTVVTTLDEVVQQYVEQTMDTYVKEYGPINAAAVVMNPKTGEIYSMYSYPEFNPNTYNNLEQQLGSGVWNGLSQEEMSKALNDAWQNFNTQHPYEPGSTLKPIVTAIALEENYIGLDGYYECTGRNNVAGANIKCWKTSGHGIQTLEQALANSCNSAMIQIAEKIPGNVFLEYLVKFGFGQPTGIDLPGEASGLLHPSNKFGPVERATASMGQGITVTPVQLLSAFSAVINGGYLIEPHIVSEMRDSDGNVVEVFTPKVKRQVISEETSTILREYLRTTITLGTGTNANIAGYTIAGKTGTAEKLPRGSGKHIVSFVGYAPMEDPEVVAFTLFDEIEEKSGAPTKAFYDMMQNILPYLGIEATSKDETTVNQTMVVPSIGTLNLYDGILTLGLQQLDYEVIGVGTKIKDQYPAEGTKLPAGASVKIYVETETPDTIIEVPSLIGLTIEEARKTTNGFFQLDIASETSGAITTQVPKAGTKIEKGNKIVVQTLE